MKRVVSISLGSKKRDHSVVVNILGEDIKIERIGTSGDIDEFKKLMADFDGKVDALGFGGMTEAIHVANKAFPLHNAKKLISHVKMTPVLDGDGLKNTLERKIIDVLMEDFPEGLKNVNAFVPSAMDRYGMTEALANAGCNLRIGDLMFALGIPIPLTSLKQLKILANLLMPVVGRFPVKWLYPVGEKQDQIVPKYKKHFDWAHIIAGDFLYIRRHMPDNLAGKVIVTNTTTKDDQELLKQRGVKTLITTTPVFEGRSYGTNVMEGVIVAISNKKSKLTKEEYSYWAEKIGLKPQRTVLNP